HAFSGVRHRQAYHRAFASRTDGQRSASGHGVNTVRDEGDQNLAHLYLVGLDEGKLFLQTLCDRDLSPDESHVDEVQDIRDDFIEADARDLPGHLPGKDHELFDDLAGVQRGFDDTLDVR